MADASVSMVLTRLAPLIEKKVRDEVFLFLNAENEVGSLSEKLKKIQEVLADAEQKGVTDPKVKSWLDKLQEIADEIDDAVDEWEVENIRQQPEESEDSSGSSSEDPWQKKVSSFLESVCLCFKQTVRRRSIALDVKHIHEKLDSIAQENENEFKFIPNIGGSVSRASKRDKSTSRVVVSEVHGRDLDKEKVMSKLFSESSSQGEDGIKVVLIVGMGGMGKTTLAQLVFNEIKNQIEFKPIWVCVSDPFDEIKIAQTILNALETKIPEKPEFETLLNCIEKSVKRKKIFLVLDDVWTEDDTMWKPLKKSLKSGAPGSIVLVTTRKESVAEVMGSTYHHQLGRLSDSDCWSVMSEIAFYKRNDPDREMLKETGLEIAKKCKGMPLAAKTMGGLLRRKSSLGEWQNVLKSEMWGLEKVRNDIFPLLTLSYNELNPAVKRCFTYCAIFPKDCLINVDDLIRFWMAQGFLSSSETMEVQGREYFEDLAMRSFFQDFEKDEMDNRIIWCKMHDMVHDFAQFLTNNEFLFLGEVDGGGKIAYRQNPRHLTVIKYKVEFDISLFPEFRSLLFFSNEKLQGPSFVRRLPLMRRTNDVPPNLFSHLKRVRLLSLRYGDLKDIPKEIGNLIHIRYLDISGNFSLKELPEVICDLYNLQTLSIEHCISLCGLPEGIDKLKNLRHLLNDGVLPEFLYPQAFEKLTNLRTLSCYGGSRRYNNKLGYLKDLNQLQGSLSIVVLGLDELDVTEADLKSKEHIKELELYFGQCGLEVVEALQPHPNLQSLDFCGMQLPNWINTLTNLRRLTVRNGFKDANSLLPVQKLPFLEYLSLLNWKMEQVGQDFFGISNKTSSPFSKLKTLCFKYCPKWKEWEDISVEEEEAYIDDDTISILPWLEKLSLSGCSELNALPHRLLHKASSLKTITISNCDGLKNRYNPDTGEDRNKIPHIQFLVD